MGSLLAPLSVPFMQRALLELALLAVCAATLGPFIVLRRLSFATHALGVGAFPGVVVAAGAGFAAFWGGLAGALGLAGLLALLGRRRDLDAPAATGLVLAGALALGAWLVSDVYRSPASVDTLLFGSLLGVGTAELLRSAAIAAACVLAYAVLGRRWLAVAFDRDAAAAARLRPALLDAVLLGLLAVTVVAGVAAVGALLVSSLLVVPAATARLVSGRLAALVPLAGAIGLVTVTAGLWLSWRSGAPPGATIAMLAAVAFLVGLAAARLSRRPGPRLAVAAAALLLALAGAGLAGGAPVDTSGRLHVVATTPIVADWARAVGGDAVSVRQLLQPNVDPHAFEPTPRDAQALADADVILAAGAGLDDWVRGLADGAGATAPIVDVAPRSGLRQQNGSIDPHYWNDPRLGEQAVRNVEQALVAADPAHAAGYRLRADAYVAQLRSLDAQLARAFAAVPSGRRVLVTDHDAFGYLADRYGLRIVGTVIPSLSTTAEPSAGGIADLIAAVRAAHVTTVFAEAGVDPRLASVVASETGARLVGGLRGDTLAPAGAPASTYLGLLRANARLILDSMTGGAKR